ncbi:hypothetical protein LTR56_023756 [Elasticomyces elasticus]|nr:hypothetical protein LTR56_023756 [Elasticomyces elasticus]KAK3662374.1 hypothetical protein LTR22_006907 [Elasticomyces elasticus]KAK4924688.1 hypothetical protein LTR49_008137 [Elasticomyces elasticus]KAK5766907.1 hypothetical protein LTS12_002983 [Elasticomyces elasticus]
MEAFTKAIQSDRLIKLVIGEGEELTTFHVSKAVLEQTSEFFCAAFRNGHLGRDEPNTLRFPQDNTESWKILLFWMLRHELPSLDDLGLLEPYDDNEEACVDHTLCIRCWALGEMYDISAFQDLIMLELLRSLETQPTDLNEIKEAFESTPPGSKLRDLMAEELAVLLGNNGVGVRQLDMFDGVPGFSSALMAKVNRRVELEPGKRFTPRVPGRPGSQYEGGSPYRDFMVSGKRPEQHWLQKNLEERRVEQKGDYGNWEVSQ